VGPAAPPSARLHPMPRLNPVRVPAAQRAWRGGAPLSLTLTQLQDCSGVPASAATVVAVAVLVVAVVAAAFAVVVVVAIVLAAVFIVGNLLLALYKTSDFRLFTRPSFPLCFYF